MDRQLADRKADMELTQTVVDRSAGYRTLDLYQDPVTQEAALPGLERIAPGFPDWIVTSLFGGTYQRPGLQPRDRQLVNLATLATLGGVDPQLTGHIRSSLRVGLTRQQVVEVFVHLAPYIGTPKALAALRVAAATFEQLDAEEAAK
ncbi:carboxymuconolactone decarboxylase family protein [Kitasatospora acidiphila]|uniref:Carboxymuconolactone decarboxylase family protein n=2 Tax=Kitasatospora acidiphila TaxID=2567942 RepID=A0A540VZT3_9ACTN|nr:carboxymuconolactone decarboxylase family protein [Kitasatospora acidiphila]